MSFFPNAHGFSLHGSTFQNVGRDQTNVTYESSPEFIKDVGAIHDSVLRNSPPRCHPDTWKEVLEEINSWIDAELEERSICWIYGSAGVGKSALAQTIAEHTADHHILGASFFFSRNHAAGHAGYLFPTIAYQLATGIDPFEEAITETLRRNPGVLQSSLDTQFKELILKALQKAQEVDGAWMSQPWVIVIDGLDECVDSITQERIIALIASLSDELLPFRFLIFSRQEPQIHEAFQINAMKSLLKHLSWDRDVWNTRRDIKRFLEAGFANVREHPRTKHLNFPDPWPDSDIIEEIVEKACGQFVYASTRSILILWSNFRSSAD
ncbi:hypothetical protein F5880DRAFT_1626214 [Lentinula raphanica]|nr:hypothetical protein F5880DRAFT_1626214 [Lentinula raphanica]